MEDIKKVIYSDPVLEFVKVGVSFCAFLEQESLGTRQEFVRTELQLLSMLYLKYSFLPTVYSVEILTEEFVTEEDRMYVQSRIANLLMERDSYYDISFADVMYCGEPMVKNISEDLTSIYQAIRNFVTYYKLGVEGTMYEALGLLIEQFDLFWGQKLVDVLRALHHVKWCLGNEDEDSEDGYYDDEESDDIY